MTSDFTSIKQKITNSKKAKIVICLPQNINYHWKYYNEFHDKQFKDMIPMFTKILFQLIPLEDIDVIYENSVTIIGSESIKASFYFNNDQFDKLTFSKDSEKITTIRKWQYNNYFFKCN